MTSDGPSATPVRQIGTPSLLRTLNDRAILGQVYDRGALTNADLVQATGLSKVTVGQGLRRLTDLGLVTVTGSHRAGRVGPAAHVFDLAPGAGHVLAVDVYNDLVHGLAVAPNGQVLAEEKVQHDGSDATEVLDALCHSLSADAPGVAGSVRSIVIAIAGAYDASDDVVRHGGDLQAVMRGLDRPGVAARLTKAVGADVTIENDVALVALAEHGFGAAAGTETSVLLWGDVGIGAAAIIGGRIHRGATGAAGELGYLPVPGAPVSADDPEGGLQSWVGGAAIRELGACHGLSGGAEEMVGAAAADAGAHSEFLDEVANRYAVGIAAFIAVLDPDIVVLSGSIVFAGGDPLADRVAASVALQALRPTPVVLGAIRRQPILTGASDLARRRLRSLLLDKVGPTA